MESQASHKFQKLNPVERNDSNLLTVHNWRDTSASSQITNNKTPPHSQTIV